MLHVKKMDFVLCMAMVINCTAQAENNFKKIGIIVNAAERFLGLLDFTAEAMQKILSVNVPSSQAPEPV